MSNVRTDVTSSQHNQTGDVNLTAVGSLFTMLPETKTKGVKKERDWKAADHFLGAQKVAMIFAEQLGEREPRQRRTLSRTVKILGVETVLALLEQTHQAEAAGGILAPHDA